MNAPAQGGPAGTAYRADIDGLRAVAILLVIGSHIGMPGMAGGFTGVDLFFVISGYLITGLLVREQDASGRIHIADFYARRVRRLLPALGIVIAATLAAGALLLLPDQQASLAQWAVAGLTFAANNLAWSTSQNYFAESSALLPLQHLWTLSVEEQFYLVWPLLLVALAKLASLWGMPRHRLITATLAAIFLGSLAASILLTPLSASGAFLLPHTRAWELAAGGLLALAPALPARLRPWLAPIGLAAIAAAMLGFDETTPFPSFNALLPVAGAIALIAAGPEGPLNRLLATRPLTAIGKLSYGWYLWHWPLLAFARNLWGTEPALARDAALALAALLLAAVSWRWIEMPVRRRTLAPFASTRATLLSAAAILAGCAALAAGLYAWSHRPFPPESVTARYLAAHSENPRTMFACRISGRISRCEVGDPTAASAILLWGDSHAAQLMAGLDRAARQAGIRIVVRSMEGCHPGGLPDAARLRRLSGSVRQCGRFNDSVLAEIPALVRDSHVRGVLFSARWEARGLAQPRLAAMLDQLHAAGLRVILARDVPEQPSNYATCVLWRGPLACAPPRADAERNAALVDAMLASLATGKPDLRLWSPRDALCPDGRCAAFIDGSFLYSDRGHLSRVGSERLAPSLAPALGWLTSRP
jgi:peptidoglycan/LPS O-acetylase OafA/YrhL